MSDLVLSALRSTVILAVMVFVFDGLLRYAAVFFIGVVWGATAVIELLEYRRRNGSVAKSNIMPKGEQGD